jgi:TPP-dependent indolepyruvate ferredoxin oxidoreductase alpha subunit
MTPEEERNLFLSKCKKEKIEPTKELWEQFQHMVMARQAIIESEAHKAFEAERKRRQQRTVQQTIAEDGGIISPIDGKAYSTERSWEDHKKAEDVIEVGNENANKKKREKKILV